MAVSNKVKRIKRSINFYQLEFNFNESFSPADGNKHREIFKIIYDLARTRAKIRYQVFGSKFVFIQDVEILPTENIIQGKLRCIRTDVFPEIMNTETDEARGIEAAEAEGILETTHFVIDLAKKDRIVLAIEHNQVGSKIGDFASYVLNIGLKKNALKGVRYIPIVNNNLAGVIDKLNRCSEFVVKVHKNNIERIKKLDGRTYTAIKAAIDQYNSEYATVILNFDYKKRGDTLEVKQSIANIIQGLYGGKNVSNNAGLFEVLEVRGENSENHDLLENFDLLVDKVKSEVFVERKQKHRTIVSIDMFNKMREELRKKKKNDPKTF